MSINMRVSRLIMQLQRRVPPCRYLNASNMPVILVLTLAILTLRAYINKILWQRAMMYRQYQVMSKDEDFGGADIRRIFAVPQLAHDVHVESARDCPLFALSHMSEQKLHGPSDGPEESVIYGSCRRVPPVQGSCDVAEQLFLTTPPASCSHQSSYNFCSLQGLLGKERVVCNETAAKVCLSPFEVGTVDEVSGEITWLQCGYSSEVSHLLNKLLKHPSSKKNLFGFCFIRCAVGKKPAEYKPPEEYLYDLDYPHMVPRSNTSTPLYGEQLLILPPQFEKEDPAETESHHQDAVSVNIVFVDSISHQHVFRSLKKSIAILENLSLASVFDFELVQAVRSRTFESLQAIFSGQVDTNSTPFGTQEIPPEPLKLEALLAGLRRKGYNTLWLEDLCYTWEWGLPKDLHFLKGSGNGDDNGDDNMSNLWQRMWYQLGRAELQDIGPTLAMCRVLEENGVKDHFHGPEAVCFNGRHQHEYLLDYLLLHQRAVQSANRPFFTFTMLNVAHEDTGRRVQTLDPHLASYIKSAAEELPNTLTILLSDHGNTYGAFIKESQEAQMELYHPAMFFIVPKNVGFILGEDVMHALKVNTRRLVSFVDLHNALMCLQNHQQRPSTKPKEDLGLFSLISSNRSCSDIPRIMPNLCICEDFEVSVSNDTDHIMLAYFAIGRLNDEIQLQSLRASEGNHKDRGIVAFTNCQRLMLKSVDNIKQNKEKDGSLTVKMELHVQSGEVFLVSLIVREKQSTLTGVSGSNGFDVQLHTYERLTAYSKFSKCANADGVWQSLCVCDIDREIVNHTDIHGIQGNDNLKIGNFTPFQYKVTITSTVHENITDIIIVNGSMLDYDLSSGRSKNMEERYDQHSKIIPSCKKFNAESLLPKFTKITKYLTIDSKKFEDTSSICNVSENMNALQCVVMMWIKHKAGVVLFAANTCSNAVILHLQVTDKANFIAYFVSSSAKQEIVTILPGGLHLIAFAFSSKL